VPSRGSHTVFKSDKIPQSWAGALRKGARLGAAVILLACLGALLAPDFVRSFFADLLWVGIIFVTTLYGGVAGLLVMLFATAAQWTIVGPSLPEYSDFYDYLVTLSERPLLLLVAVGFLTALRRYHATELSDLRAQLQSRTSQANLITDHCEKLRNDLDSLERRLACGDDHAALRADSDEAGQAFQCEADHAYRSEAGHDSESHSLPIGS
jgi:hypothetical protein